MPIHDGRIKNPAFTGGSKHFTDENRKRLALLVSELKNRGLQLPPEAINRKLIDWVVDQNGYFPKLDGKFYTPTANQSGFVHSFARFVAFFGSRGSGKSGAGAQKAMRKVQAGENGAVLNPDFENFKISTWPEFRMWIPWENVVPAHRYRQDPEWYPYQPFNLTFMNGVNVICKGLKDPDSARGPNINWLWYDEAGRDPTGQSWQLAIASVRVGYAPQAWITTTPNVKAPWVRKFFLEKDIPEDAIEEFKKEGLNREFIETFFGTIYDNRDNLDPGYFASMLAAYPSGWLRQQEIFGQFVDEGGALGDRSWFKNKMVNEPPFIVYRRLRYWDLAATEKKLVGPKRNDPDESVGTLMSMSDNLAKPEFCIENQVHGFWKWENLIETLINVARMDGPSIRIIVEEEPGSGGKNQVAMIDKEIKEAIPGHPGVLGWRPDNDRVILANFWFADAAEGRVYMVVGDWNKEFFNQLDIFPGDTSHTHDDRITSTSGARMNLAPPKKWRQIDFLSV